MNTDARVMDQLQKAIDKMVEDRVAETFDKHMEAFKKEAQEIRKEVIATAVMKFSNWYSFQDLGSTLRIEVKQPNGDK